MSRFKYRYSFLVPTHQRGSLLGSTLRGLLAQQHDNFQVVVSNNYSMDDTRAVLAEFEDDDRVTIVHTDRKMSMPDHWEFAMDYVDGEHVIILGDDDGVRTDFLAALDIVLEETGANIVKFKTALYYHADWPDEKRNRFEFDERCTNDFFVADKHAVIADFCAFRDYMVFPNLLQTSFSLELFRKVRARCGQMFVGAPDWSCPFLLLADTDAKLAYVDSTLGYGGRSQMSNAAYYESKAETSNDRINDFVAELTAKTRFPFHEPQITTAGNFMPAAFSFAKHFYPHELAEYALDAFELAKVIQQDIGEEFASARSRFWMPTELDSFREFVDTLPAAQRSVVVGMPGYFSLKGRVSLMLKWLKRRVGSHLPAALRDRLVALPGGQASRYPWTATLRLTDVGITTGADLMERFREVVGPSDQNEKSVTPTWAVTSGLARRGRLNLPLGPSPIPAFDEPPGARA